MIVNFLKAIGITVGLFIIIWSINKFMIITGIKTVNYIEFPIWGYILLIFILFNTIESRSKSESDNGSGEKDN